MSAFLLVNWQRNPAKRPFIGFAAYGLLFLLLLNGSGNWVHAAAPTYTLIEIPIPEGFSSMDAIDINNENQVLLGGISQFGRALLWLPEPDYGYPQGLNVIDEVIRAPEAINDHGAVVGRAWPVVGEPQVGFVWQNGQSTYVNLGDGQINDATEVIAINNNGAYTGRYKVPRLEDPDLDHLGNPVPTLQAAFLRNPTEYTLRNPASPDISLQIYDINNNGVVLGFHSDGMFTWNGAEHALVGGSMSVAIQLASAWSKINDKGQIVAPGVTLWLPEPDYGLPAGVNTIPFEGDFTQPLFINNNGQILTKIHLWDRGTLTKLVDLVPEGETLEIATVAAINDSGSFIGKLTNRSSFIMIASSDPLSVAFETPDKVDVGDPLAVKAQVTTKPEATIRRVGWRGGGVAVTDGADLVEADGPTDPSARFDLEAGQTVDFTRTFNTSESGRAVFEVTARGILEDTLETTTTGQSSPVSIVAQGDLLIKRTDGPDTEYSLDDVYQNAPVGRQRRTDFVRSTDEVAYQVRIENDSSSTTTFLLRVEESQTDQWTSIYQVNGSDVSQAAVSPEGWETPELESGASITIDVTLTPPSEPVEDEAETLLYILGESTDTTALDSVAIVASLRDVIVVNVTGDESDADPEDGVIDVDLDEDGEQITLRAAIDFANERDGKDRIEFDIPGAGVPTIELSQIAAGAGPMSVGADGDLFLNLDNDAAKGIIKSSLVIDDPVEIDATTQAGGMVEISGEKLIAINREESGASAINGIEVRTNDSEIRGFVINRFPGFGLALTELGGNWIAGNWIGLDKAGIQPLGNGTERFFLMDRPYGSAYGGGILVNSPVNLVGGHNTADRNVLAGSGDLPGVEFSARPSFGSDLTVAGSQAVNNLVLGNYIGLNRLGETVLLRKVGPSGNTTSSGLWIKNNARGNRIGDGTTAGSNLINSFAVGNGAVGTELQGNNVGFNARGLALTDPDLFHTITRCTDTLIQGNRFAANGLNMFQILTVDGLRFFGNEIGIRSDGTADAISASQLFLVLGSSQGVVIGGPEPGEGNLMVQAADGTRASLLVTDSSGDSNDLAFVGNTILPHPAPQTTIYPVVTDLKWDGPDSNDSPDLDGKQNYPVITSATLEDNSITIDGFLDTHVGGGLYYLDFYAITQPAKTGHGGAMTYLGRQNLDVDLAGIGAIQLSIPVSQPLQIGRSISVTATRASDHSTSEFSKNVVLEGPGSTDSDGISDAHENLFGDRNNDGLNDSEQDNVASFTTSTGEPLTVAIYQSDDASSTSNQVVKQSAIAPRNDAGRLERVRSETQASVGAPTAYEYPFGLLSLTILDVSVGGSVTITLIPGNTSAVDTLLSLEVDSTWAEAAAPAWDGSELQFELVDGGFGDSDNEANGRIVSVIGLATSIPTSESPGFGLSPIGNNTLRMTLPLNTSFEQLQWSTTLQQDSWIDLEGGAIDFTFGPNHFDFEAFNGGVGADKLFFRLRQE